MAFSTTGAKGLSSEINITPLIDVLLVLLIIFMVIVPLAPMGLDAALPQPNQQAAAPELLPPPVMIEVHGDSAHPAYRIDGAPVEAAAIEPRLRESMAPRAERQVLIQADARLDFGTVSRVIDAGHAAGADTVGLVPLATR